MIKITDYTGNAEYFKVGIYTKVQLDEVKYETTDKGAYVDFVYKTLPDTKLSIYNPETGEYEEGSIDANIKDRKRVFVPKPGQAFPFDGETKEEAAKREERDFIVTLSTHLSAVLTTEEALNFSADNIQDLINKTTNILNQRKDKAFYNVKVRYNKDLMYSEFPGRGKQWFEPYKEGEPTKLKFSPWEIKNRVNKFKKDDLADLI